MSNYFELYDLPVSFHPDATAVKSKFYELSRRYHPDRFAQAGGAELAEALQMASLNNAAYKTLQNRDAVMAYILKLNDLLANEEKYALPPAFLMEMMDINEAISDYEASPDNENARKQAEQDLNDQLAAWEAATEKLTARYDAGEHDNALLLQIKDMYFRKKYLLRIKERIGTFASH